MRHSDNKMVFATLMLSLLVLGTSFDVTMALTGPCFDACHERCAEQDVLPVDACKWECGCPFPEGWAAPPPPR